MIIAQQKRQENIAEYVLYIWQLEDIIRAYKFDIDKIESEIIKKFNQPFQVETDIKKWYVDFINAMKSEKITEKGHVTHIKGIVAELQDFSNRLLLEDIGAAYKEHYDKALPHIQALIAKSGNESTDTIEAAFNGMYGLLMLKLSKKEISKETQEGFATISTMLAHLADLFKKYEKDDICFD